MQGDKNKMIIDKQIQNKEYDDAVYHCMMNGAGNLAKLILIALEHRKLKENEVKENEVKENEVTEVNIVPEAKKERFRVLLMCNWCSSDELVKNWRKMSENNDNIWKDMEIVSEEPCDYYCIINRPPANASFDPKRTVIFRMEPYMERDERQWGEFCKPDSKEYKFVGYHDIHFNNNEWHLSLTYQQLLNQPIEKKYDNILSTILSDKYKDPGHIKRVDFIKFVEKKMEVDVFGSNKFLWKKYKGSLPMYKKDESLIPYKYGFNVENHSIKNYYTEKLIDGILSETLMFYSGCYNVRDYIDERAYVYLELSNFEKDYMIIKKAMEEDWYSQRLPYIKEAKQKILNELQFYPRLYSILHKQNESA